MDDGYYLAIDLIYQKYTNPFVLFKTMSMSKGADFVLYLIEKNIDERSWQIYLHSNSELTYDDYKKKYNVKSIRSKKSDEKVLGKDKEIDQLKSASKVINFNFGGKEDNQ